MKEDEDENLSAKPQLSVVSAPMNKGDSDSQILLPADADQDEPGSPRDLTFSSIHRLSQKQNAKRRVGMAIRTKIQNALEEQRKEAEEAHQNEESKAERFAEIENIDEVKEDD